MNVADLEILTVAVRPRMGGMTSWIDQLASGLSRRGWKVRVFGVTDMIDDSVPLPYELVHVPVSAPGSIPIPVVDPWRRWRMARQFFKKQLSNKPPPKLWMSDGTAGPMFLARDLAKEDGRPRVVLTGGNLFAETANQPLASWFHKKVRSAMESANRIIVDGPDLVEALGGEGISPTRISVHYHGVDLSRFAVQSEGVETFFSNRRKPGEFRLVWHGRLAEHHGSLRFLDIAEKIEGCEVRMGGKGPLEVEVRKRLDHLGKPEWYCGFVPDERLGAFLGEGDAAVYPLEAMAGLPTVLLEAMAAGRPTLTYETGAVGELIRHGWNGFVAQTENEMVETLETLIADPDLREQVGAQARADIEKDWSLDPVLDRIESELREIALS